MTPELLRRAEEVFDEALSVELSGRSAFLDAVCTDDPPGVRTEVESLLAHYEQAAAAGFLNEPLQKGIYGLDSPPVGEPASEEAAHVPPGYEFLGDLGRGGMGVVYKVRQTSLNRLLALKMIRAGSLAHPEELARFRAEAEAVARFQHPNLVQIYEVGQDQGRAYCTLEYVAGGSLAQKLSGKPLPVREAAALAETLARAVHYAHGHGILHRDLKPSNVLLTTDGVPKITDFGLAKRLDLDQGLTETGRGMGTPSYMAPEQAEGKKNIGPAADLYSLGAILYEMLSGRPPFVGVTPYEIIEQVKNHEPLPFLRLRIRVPRDLETICRKCLQKDPARRYAAAGELADDLHRFLAGEPIQARPVGRLARLGRWCRRKPVIAGLIAALVLVFAGGVTAATREWMRAENGWAKAEAEFLDHHKSVESFYQLATEDDRLYEPASQPLAKKWREAALAYFRRFLEQRGQDSRLQAEIAQAQFRIAQMTDALGSKADALREYEQAALGFEKLCADNPTEVKYQFGLALAYQNRGILQGETKDRQKALDSLDQARQLFQGLAQGNPDDTEAQHGLSETHLSSARIQLRSRQFPEALDRTRQAVVILEKLVETRKDSVPFRFELANGYSQLGILYHTLKRPEALPSYQKALELLEGLVVSNRDRPLFQSARAKVQHGMGLVLIQSGQKLKAVTILRQAVITQEELAKSYPAWTDFQRDLAESYLTLGDLRDDLGSYQKARNLLIRLVKDHPDQLDYRLSLARSCYNIAYLLREKDPKAALQSLEQAREQYQQVIEGDDAAIQLRMDLARTCVGIDLLAAAHEPEKAKEALTQAQNLVEKLDPPDAPSLEALAELCLNLGTLKNESPTPEASLFFLRKAETALTKLTNINPANPEYHSRLSNTFIFLGRTYERHGRAEDALAAYRGAIEPRRAALNLCRPDSDQWKSERKALSEYLVALAKAQRDRRQLDESVATCLERKGLWPRDANELYRTARLIALCIPLAGAGETDRDRYAAQAVAVLGEAIDSGYQNVQQMEKAPEWKPLQSREDFQQLLARLKEKQNQKAKEGPKK